MPPTLDKLMPAHDALHRMMTSPDSGQQEPDLEKSLALNAKLIERHEEDTRKIERLESQMADAKWDLQRAEFKLGLLRDAIRTMGVVLRPGFNADDTERAIRAHKEVAGL